MTAAPFNLLTERWLPVRRRSGGREWITPAQITDGLSADPVVAFDWPRPDFNGASLEFMVGLITTAAAPADEQGWREWWHAPPPPDVLAERFAAVTHAFNLDGDGPRFMQDHSGLRDGKAKDRHISVLLIDTPGAQTLAHNTDIFVRRGRIERLGRPAVAMALYTLQSYAPSGGRGHRTSLRGGGPLTTLVASTPPGTGDCLWGTVWPNVETVAQITGRGDGTPADTIFPWLEPTRMSRKGDPQTTPANVHPLQVYWGMPRCAHVVFDAHEAAACSLTNLPEHSTASRLRSVQYGTDYASHAFDHPLSPYYRQKSGADRIPVHANPGILGYHAWPGVVVPTNDRLRQPARTVSGWLGGRGRASSTRHVLRLHAYGYDMDNAKARAWMESEMRLWHIGDHVAEQWVEIFVQRAVAGARVVSGMLVGGIKRSRRDRPKDANGDYGFVEEQFFRDTEAPFQAALGALPRVQHAANGSEDPLGPLLHRWRDTIEEHALRIFDQLAPPDELELRNMRRHVAARAALSKSLRGYPPQGRKLHTALELPLPAKRPRATAEKDTA